MVVYDNEFKVDLSKLTDKQLQKRRLKFVSGLYNGDKGSRDNIEKESLIQEIDVERELRFKKNTEKRSNIALLISIICSIIMFLGMLLFNSFVNQHLFGFLLSLVFGVSVYLITIYWIDKSFGYNLMSNLTQLIKHAL